VRGEEYVGAQARGVDLREGLVKVLKGRRGRAKRNGLRRGDTS
jgi:hypothetical protein